MPGTYRLIGAAIGIGVLSLVPEASDVRDKLDAYLLNYQDRLSAVVAIEVNSQQLEGPEPFSRGNRVFEPGPRRTIESEVSFGTLPGEGGWLGFRRVRRVDRRSIRDTATSIDELLRSSEHQDAAKKLLEQGARHNLGGFRNTNLPNLPLELLHPRHRHRFDHTVTGTTRIAGTQTTILVARERGVPAIIRTYDGIDLSSTVTAWVDDEGRLLQAEVRTRAFPLEQPQIEPVVLVKFRRNAELGLLVPVEMREVFGSDTNGKRGTGVARYRDFRRFETSARIVPPG